jgi:hypothetical protein
MVRIGRCAEPLAVDAPRGERVAMGFGIRVVTHGRLDPAQAQRMMMQRNDACM